MSYRKGVFYERELLHYLNGKGFAVMRSPSSGGFLSPVDIVAIKKGLVVGIESKAYKTKPRLQKKQLTHLKEWCDKAGALGLLAWRTKNNKWLFLPLKNAEQNQYEDENWLEMDKLLDMLDFR